MNNSGLIILVGMGKENGDYSKKSVIKLGIYLTFVSFITVVFLNIFGGSLLV